MIRRNRGMVEHVARQLARSGHFPGWKAIEDKLGQSLDEPFERSEIDRLCKQANPGASDD